VLRKNDLLQVQPLCSHRQKRKYRIESRVIFLILEALEVIGKDSLTG